MGNKEVGGVAIAFVGFVALTMAFKGTWSNVWGALLGHSTGAAAAGAGSSSTSSAPTTPGSGAGSGRPGSSPAPAPFPVRPSGR